MTCNDSLVGALVVVSQCTPALVKNKVSQCTPVLVKIIEENRHGN
jgi:hypothetical protein